MTPMLASYVIWQRMLIIAAEAAKPTPAGQRELADMVSEKQMAWLEAVGAWNASLTRSWGDAWLMPLRGAPPRFDVERALRRAGKAAEGPYHRRVGANAKRLAARR